MMSVTRSCEQEHFGKLAPGADYFCITGKLWNLVISAMLHAVIRLGVATDLLLWKDVTMTGARRHGFPQEKM